MSIRQPVRRAARRAFWPSLPIASESWKSGTTTRADRASPEEDAERLGQIKAFTRAVDLVQQCMDAGRMLPEFTDAFAVATIVWAHVHGLVSLMITKTDFPWPRDPEWLDLAVASCATSFLRAPDDR